MNSETMNSETAVDCLAINNLTEEIKNMSIEKGNENIINDVQQENISRLSQEETDNENIQEDEEDLKGTSKMSHEEFLQLYKLSASLPLVEAIKLELLRLQSSVQTPVSLLQDLLSRRGTAPKYELIQIEGGINEPIFKYRITIEADSKLFVAIGSGNSKKQAKHNAAKSVLDNIIEADNLRVQKEAYSKSDTNPISQLQEECLIRKWPPAIYETEETTGFPHERIFTVSVYVDTYKKTGTGKSKKLAKSEAAITMLNFLKTIPFEYNLKKSADDNTTKQSGDGFLNPENIKKISRYHVRVEKNIGPFLKQLQRLNISDILDPVQFLLDLCIEMGYELTFIRIEEKDKNNMYQSLVQITTKPVSVFCGTGETEVDAQTKAVKEALDFIKIMNQQE